ncbi:hypothetical protein BIW11_01042 [Tropilaelaps mercedesae]|uniref:N-acetyltransferase domain-containing protein n=1 Tax=Tropilaelaps mercedesae TaxID=418985 RepID=A0A1V9XKM9_9ACAR|nr:hypothetical protein BIW11_01042 [Tropilaelaps mercedesae]
MSAGKQWTVRPLKPAEVDAAAQFWAFECGLDIGVGLFPQWFRIDPEAFLVAVDKDGSILGSASAVRQTDSVYLVGTVGTAKNFRRKGIATEILREIHARCPSATYALSSVPEVLCMYEAMGYKAVENMYANIYQGKLEEELSPKVYSDIGDIVVVRADDEKLVNEVAEYDKDVHGYARDVRLALTDDPAGLVVAMRRSEGMVGFGKVQPNLRDGGAWIGPIYADNESIAKQLLEELLTRFENLARISIYIVVSDQARSFERLRPLKCTEVSPRCYKGAASDQLPPMKLKKLFVFDSLDFCLL